ncbi:unnamed protein product [Leuciscus chuanchicus]
MSVRLSSSLSCKTQVEENGRLPRIPVYAEIRDMYKRAENWTFKSYHRDLSGFARLSADPPVSSYSETRDHADSDRQKRKLAEKHTHRRERDQRVAAVERETARLTHTSHTHNTLCESASSGVILQKHTRHPDWNLPWDTFPLIPTPGIVIIRKAATSSRIPGLNTSELPHVSRRPYVRVLLEAIFSPVPDDCDTERSEEDGSTAFASDLISQAPSRRKKPSVPNLSSSRPEREPLM